jgi:hypothetical protein
MWAALPRVDSPDTCRGSSKLLKINAFQRQRHSDKTSRHGGRKPLD